MEVSNPKLTISKALPCVDILSDSVIKSHTKVM